MMCLAKGRGSELHSRHDVGQPQPSFRNDYRSNRKQWMPTQVHHVAAAHMSSYNAALIPQVTILNNNTQGSASTMDTNTPQPPLNHSQTIHQGMTTAPAGPLPTDPLPATRPPSGQTSSPSGMILPMQQVPTIHSYQCTAPGLLQGHRRSVDASTTPDHTLSLN
jgi:hypothetical protein